MSDNYEAVVDIEASLRDAERLAQRVVARLSKEDLILPTIDADACLGGEIAYRPGSRVPTAYKREPQEGEFWTLRTNGMEVVTSRWVNEFSFPEMHYYACPRCGTRFEPGDGVAEEFYRAVGEFYNGNERPNAKCPQCLEVSAVQDWHTKPHLGFAYLAFLFWNWPPLDSSSWRIDIPCIIADELRHRVVVTFGHV